MKFELDRTIDAPPEKVFRLATDPDRFGEWMQGLVRLERATAGPLRIGSRWRETRKVMGNEATEEFEVTALDPPRRLELFVDGAKGSNRKGEHRYAQRFEPAAGGGTRVVLSGEITKLGCVGTVFGFLFAAVFRKIIGKDLDAMKAWIEKQP